MATKGKPAQPSQPPDDDATIVLDSETLLADATPEPADDAPSSDGATVVLEQSTLAAASADDSSTRVLPTIAAQSAESAPSVPTALPAALESAEADKDATKDPAATNQLAVVQAAAPGGAASAILDEIDPEWSLADQPTVQMAPQIMAQVMPPAARRMPTLTRPARPAFLETGEQDIWPSRPAPQAQATPIPQTRHTPSPIPRPVSRPLHDPERIPSPTGRQPLAGNPAAFSNPRMRRLMELRLQRGAHTQGHRAPNDNLPVAQMVRQWWSDLLPGLQTALDHQHEARASGVYPIPAHVQTPASGLGDAFGRLAGVVRGFGGRAQALASPALNRLHERAEHAAQALVEKIEGSPVRQQAPLLGPGRLAVFFEQGVTVGQAQRLLMTNQARPMRLIPRRHGFLALVQPGQESDVGEQLKHHPYVRDVVYIAYGANGQPVSSR